MHTACMYCRRTYHIVVSHRCCHRCRCHHRRQGGHRRPPGRCRPRRPPQSPPMVYHKHVNGTAVHINALPHIHQVPLHIMPPYGVYKMKSLGDEHFHGGPPVGTPHVQHHSAGCGISLAVLVLQCDDSSLD